MNNIKVITPNKTEILTGTPGFKIGSQHFVGGIGGNFIPGAQISVPTKFYKCASVSSSTWTGYKAVQDSTTKVWSYESTLTSDTLTFDSTKVTPVVGSVYTNDAIIRAVLYEGWIAPPGAIFYEPFTADVSAAQTGQAYTKTGTLTFAADSTLGCNVATFDGSAYLDIANTDIPSGTSDLSVSYWVKWGSTSSAPCVFIIGSTSNETCFGTYNGNNGYHGATAHGPSDLDNLKTATSSGTWEFYVWTRSGNTWTLYKNGASASTVTYYGSIAGNPTFYIGRYIVDNDMEMNGALSSFRIYARALTQAEVTTLYQEH